MRKILNIIKKITISLLLLIGLAALLFSLKITRKWFGLEKEPINTTLLNSEIKKEDVLWHFNTKLESDGVDAPQMAVEIEVKGKKYPAGNYEGTCSETNNNLTISEISGAMCWWAGSGTELGLFLQDQKFVLKKRIVQEGAGDSGQYFGEFNTILEII